MMIVGTIIVNPPKPSTKDNPGLSKINEDKSRTDAKSGIAQIIKFESFLNKGRAMKNNPNGSKKN